MEESRPGRPHRGRDVLVAVLGVLVVLAAAEIVTRLWIQSPSVALPDARYDFVLPPHARIAQMREGWSVSRTNSMGLLDDELRAARPPVRALLLGNSFTEAVEVARRDNYQSVAERRVPGLEIVSVGYGGRSPVQYADWLEDYAAPLAPDLVIIQVWDDDLPRLVAPAALARMAERARLGPTPPPPPPPEDVARRGLRAAVRGSALLNAAWQRCRRSPESFDLAVALARGGDLRSLAGRLLRGNTPLPPPPRTLADDPRQAAVMDSLHRRIAARAPRLLYLYVPQLRWLSPGCPARDSAAAVFFHRFAERNHVRLIDPSGALRAEFARTGQPPSGFANTVPGRGHLNAVGHRVIGEELARAIADELR